MEDSSGERDPPASTPQLLNLIRDEREWTVTREVEDGGAGSASATATASRDHPEEDYDSKLELRLCLPGAQDDERTPPPPPPPGEKGTCTSLSLGSGCFPSHPKLAASAGASTASATTGAKRGFLATVGAKTQGM